MVLESEAEVPATSVECKYCRAYLAEQNTNERFQTKPNKEKPKAVHKKKFMVRSHVNVSKSWIVDSGATSHIANDQRSSLRLYSFVLPVISTADSKTTQNASYRRCWGLCDSIVDNNGEEIEITLIEVIYAPVLEETRYLL